MKNVRSHLLKHVKCDKRNLLPWENIGYHPLKQFKCDNRNLPPWENIGSHFLKQFKCDNRNLIPWENIGSHLLKQDKCDNRNLLPWENIGSHLLKQGKCNNKNLRSKILSWKQILLIALDVLKKIMDCVIDRRDFLESLWSVLDNWWWATALCGGYHGHIVIW